MLNDAAEKVKKLVAALPGAAPAGVDVTFDPEFERAKAEVDKLAVVAGETPNWALVEEACASLLESKSKDLRAATWWGLAAVQRRQWAGLAEAARLLRDLTAQHWDHMF